MGIPGAWIFTPWDKDDFQITEDTTVTGSWTFTPYAYKVTYVVEEDTDWGKPDDSVTPTDGTAYDYKDDVTVAPDLTTVQSYAKDKVTGENVPGTWAFTPWDKDDFQITEDTTVTGKWTFTPDTCKVTYVVNGDPTYGTPAGGTAPTDENNPYDYKEQVTVKDNLTTSWTTSDGTDSGIPGTWTFTPWDKDDFQITEDTTITGSWKFTPALAGSLTISKNVTGDLGDKTKYFTFKVEFDSDKTFRYTGSKNGTISSGDIIQLKHGESITILNVPAGTGYTVTESRNSGYTVYASGDTGIIAEGKTSTAKFTNTRSSVPKTGDDSNINLWFALLAISGACMIGAAVIGRKRYAHRHKK